MAPLDFKTISEALEFGQEVHGEPLHESCRFRFRPTSATLVIAPGAGRRCEAALRKQLAVSAAGLRGEIDSVAGKFVRGCPSWIVPRDHQRISSLDRPRHDIVTLAGRAKRTLPVSRLLVRHDELVQLLHAHGMAAVSRFGRQIVHVVRSSPEVSGFCCAGVRTDEHEQDICEQWQRSLETLARESGEEFCHDPELLPGSRLAEGLTSRLGNVVVLTTVVHPAALTDRGRSLVALMKELDDLVTESPQPTRVFLRGPTLERDVTRIENVLSDIDTGLDLERIACPANRAEARRAFQAGEDPQFTFEPSTIDVEVVRSQMFSLPLESLTDSWSHRALLAKVEELDLELTALASIGTPYFLATQMKLHGRPRSEHLAIARHDLSTVDAPPARKETSRSTRQIRQFFDGFAYEVPVRTLPGLQSPRWRAGALELPRGFKVPESAWLQFLAGIVPLILAGMNGCDQESRLCASGLPGWSGVREGFSMYWQSHLGELPVRRRRDAALLFIGADALCDGAGLREIHERFRDWGESHRHAYQLAERLFWGGGWLANACAFGHYLDLHEYMQRGGDHERLLAGCIPLEWLEGATLGNPLRTPGAEFQEPSKNVTQSANPAERCP